jgi:hypothetical protein
MVAGDANGDGLGLFAGNDPVYLPKNAADITLDDPAEWPALDSIIRSQSCVEAQRGHVMRRNSCRAPWLTLLNARVSKRFQFGRGQSLELTADLFNALNFFDSDWGVQRIVAIGQEQGQPQILLLTGYDQINERGTYMLFPPDRRLRDDEATRWRVQLGVRYGF